MKNEAYIQNLVKFYFECLKLLAKIEYFEFVVRVQLHPKKWLGKMFLKMF